MKETWIEKREKSIQQDILKREFQMISMKNVRKGGGPEGGVFMGNIYTLFVLDLIDWTLRHRVNKRERER